jgi:CheY-specific phosphatase CheX
MSVKFFGQFLLERVVLTPEQLLEAVSYQENRNLRFGQYAERKGFLTSKDVKLLNNEQKKTDLKIGELAVKLGMLSNMQVEEILTMQRNDHVQIGQTLLMKGFIDEATLDSELEAFREDQKAYDGDSVIVPEGIRNGEVLSTLVDITLKMLQRVAKVDVKADEGEVLGRKLEEAYSAVSITLSGGLNCDYVLLSDEGVSRAIASAIIGQDASEEDRDMVVDGVKEFANVVCGNILGKMAQRGMSVEISIPHTLDYGDGYGLIGAGPAVAYKMPTTAGNATLVLVLL